ncbi:MAG TPA: Hsp20/alpha crystallin family protein [Opitutaceae bacterium]|nr:Hsp20/alpha crystallin family protein [Opitutaceae bacterium]HND61824.1 Hsp20/alpha crystallin family protein [Opitutaceae bacterium]
MHTIIHPLRPAHRPSNAEISSFQAELRKPSYDCREHQDAVKLTVYVPGVDAAGVEIEGRGPDLVVTARKTQFVRVNWQALHLEGAQRDYQLRLRLGHGLDYAALTAEIQHGVLTISIPKRATFAESPPARRVA